ncbi:hypothetical protein M1L60_04590 [Actinoplanes sp. TRM 88003]|uniref:Integral membrane protein n=1 Tax=Paractinoplanes aksuensis TaxID=2939490 RepID=A0ABT1DGC1_9ACTN|nr:hypothetical protein [Actinoplanes aksuensis]MCO8269869.1 hypothetical protein [Actinoplanes aksuensis]
MIGGVRLGIAALVGWAGAWLWAYGLAVLQPLCEPGSPFWESAENNSYWARDVRWSAILAVSAVLAAVSRRSWLVAVALPWLAADIVLDRIDPGRPALLPATLIAGVLVTAVAIPAALRPPRRPLALWIPLACLFTASTVVTLESPSDAEPQLALSRLAAYVVCAIATIVCVLAALKPSVLERRWPVVAGFAVAVALFGLAPPWVTFGLMALGAATIVLLREPWPGPRRAAGVVALHVAGLIAAGFVLLLTLLQAGRPFTALAGNEPVNAADSDPTLLIWSVTLAVVWAALVHLAKTVTTQPRPHPAAAG